MPLINLTVDFESDWPGVPGGREVGGRALVASLVLLACSGNHEAAAVVDANPGINDRGGIIKL